MKLWEFTSRLYENDDVIVNGVRFWLSNSEQLRCHTGERADKLLHKMYGDTFNIPQNQLDWKPFYEDNKLLVNILYEINQGHRNWALVENKRLLKVSNPYKAYLRAKASHLSYEELVEINPNLFLKETSLFVLDAVSRPRLDESNNVVDRYFPFWIDLYYKAGVYFESEEEASQYESHPKLGWRKISEVVSKPCKVCGKHSSDLLFGVCLDCAAAALQKPLLPYRTDATSLGFHGEGNYFGVELEYETSNLQHSLFMTHQVMSNFILTKQDGSVPNGFEIVTAPATKDILLTHFEKLFSWITQEKANSLFKTTPYTGMHVHIGKGKQIAFLQGELGVPLYTDFPVSYLQVGKMLNFIHSPINKAFIEFIAGRAENRYCRNGFGTRISDAKKSRDRYVALNTKNKNTVELRIFSTPTTFEEFHYKLDFSTALPLFCRDVSMRCLTAEKFREFIKDNRGQYKALAKFLK